MTSPTKRPAPRKGAPAASLLRRSTAPRPVEPEPDFGPLPPLPDAPPPLPEGAVEGFDDLPEGAKAAAPLDLTDVDLTPSDVPVDPTTGEEGLVPRVERGGASEELKRELDMAEKLREAELRAAAAEAELESLRESVPMDIEGANDIGGIGPAGQVHPDEHRAAQARYRALRHQQLVNGPQPEPSLEAPAVELETPEEHQARVRAEAKTEYERRVVEMDPAEPVYLVGPRPPRPKVAGHTLSIGDVVPGAHYFPRLESWLSTGILVRKDR